MSSVFVAGPCSFFADAVVANTMAFVGFSESGIRVTPRANYEPVYTDVSGRAAWDYLFMGEEAVISADLNLYNESTLNVLRGRMRGATSGLGASGSIGTLMRTEGRAFRLILNMPYVSKTAFSTMEPLLNFGAGFLDDAYEMTLGTRVKVMRCIFRVIPVFALDGSYSLYSTSLGGLTLPVIS